MTNQNPTVPQSNSPKLDRDILAKVNAHAERSIDRLFSDIEDLLNGDDEVGNKERNSIYPTQQHQLESERQQQVYSQEHYDRSESDFERRQLSASPLDADTAEDLQPETATPKQKKHVPFWLKTVLGVGATTAAVGGGLMWLVNERKIELPKTIDTSWLPFQSQSPSAAEDFKFADYMRKSIAKIEATANAPTPAAVAPNYATVPTNPTAPIAANPTSTIAVPVKAAPVPPKNAIALIKTISNTKNPSATFTIERQTKIVTIGQKIGTSNWSLLTVAKNEVLIKRKGGEIRSVYVGQKF